MHGSSILKHLPRASSSAGTSAAEVIDEPVQGHALSDGGALSRFISEKASGDAERTAMDPRRARRNPKASPNVGLGEGSKYPAQALWDKLTLFFASPARPSTIHWSERSRWLSVTANNPVL